MYYSLTYYLISLWGLKVDCPGKFIQVKISDYVEVSQWGKFDASGIISITRTVCVLKNLLLFLNA